MSPIRQRVELGPQWPTLDPFLFCAHHLDHYPVADGSLAPVGSRSGRQIGQDFAGIDGWNLYHGSPVAGFPQHPHRGFETITFVRRGWCDHADSLGARARFGMGDVQWITAGSGIVHSEMFPLFSTVDAEENTLELFQLWLNLPSDRKMVPPSFSMRWADELPVVASGGQSRVTVLVGAFGEVSAPSAPPDSWANGDTDVQVWHVALAGGDPVRLPPAASGSARVIYLFSGGPLTVDEDTLASRSGAVLDPGRAVVLTASGSAEALVLQGRPIGEPVAQQGPFVMNDRAGLAAAFDDYRRTGFGGWPWNEAGPVHGPEPRRFVDRGSSTVTS